MNRRRAVASAAIALMVALPLGACSAKDKPKADSASSQASQSGDGQSSEGQSSESQPSEGQSGDSKPDGESSGASTAPEPAEPPSDLPTDDPTIESSAGSTVSTSGELPSGFPKDRVPLISGKILSATDAAAEYTVALLHDGGVKPTYSLALAKLTDAGFKVVKQRKAPGARYALVQVSDMKVELTVSAQGTKQSMAYYFLAPR